MNGDAPLSAKAIFGSEVAALTPEQQAGLDGERHAVGADANLGHVPESVSWRCDAVVTTDAPYGDRGTPVEIKSCKRWKPDGDYRRAGEWIVRRDQHRWLHAHGGVYALLVYREGSGRSDDRAWLASLTLPAEAVDAVIETWWNYGRYRQATNLPWTRVLDRTVVCPDD